MLKKILNYDLLTGFLAVFVVLLMTASAFIGAAQDGAIKEDFTQIPENNLPTHTDAEQTTVVWDYEGAQDIQAGTDSNSVVEFDGSNNYPGAIIPVEYSQEMGTLSDLDPSLTGLSTSSLIDDGPVYPGMEQNSISTALEYVSPLKDNQPSIQIDTNTESSVLASVSGENNEGNSRAPTAISLMLGADNFQYPGQSIGRIYSSGSSYSTLSYYTLYTYGRSSSSSGSVYHGWAVFNLRDLAAYEGVKITSGRVVYRQDYKYYGTQIDFWSMKSIPYDGLSGSAAQSLFNEVGGSGSTLMGSASLLKSNYYDGDNKDISATLTTNGISELNKRLSSASYDFAIGSDISQYYTGYSYGYTYGYDVRLELNFTVTSLPDGDSGEIAVGDVLSGFVSTSTMYDYGRIYTSTSYRAFATWDVSQFKNMIPEKGPTGEPVVIKGISLRLDNGYSSCYLTGLTINNMSLDPRNYLSSPSTLHGDCGDGTTYVPAMDYAYYTTPQTFEWELGPDALEDFNYTLEGKTNFFA